MAEVSGNAITGTQGDDSLRGEGAYDRIYGGAGDDWLSPAGRGGAAWGGDGDDELVPGGDRTDYLWGGAGDDLIHVSGRTIAWGGDGDDVFDIEEAIVNGEELVYGGVRGGDGLDIAILHGDFEDFDVSISGVSREGRIFSVGLTGVEVLRFDDRDVLYADLYPAEVVPGTGYGGRGLALAVDGAQVTVYGSDEPEIIAGSANTTTIFGGDGADDILFRDSQGTHRIYAGGGGDWIEAYGDVRIDAGDGNDRILGGGGIMTIDGGSGEDTVYYNYSDSDEFSIEILGEGHARVTHIPTDIDGIAHSWDEITNVETLHFDDRDITLTGPPVTDAEQFETDEDAPLEISAASLLDGDVDPLGGTLELVRVEGATGGTATLEETGEVRFVPLPGFHGEAGFDYWVRGMGGESLQHVSVTVHSTNHAPEARDDAFAALTGERTEGDLLADNGDGADSDPDGDALTVANVGGVAVTEDGPTQLTLDHGVIFKAWADGSVVWDLEHVDDLAPGETAEVSVSYVISDQEDGMSVAEAILTMTGVPGSQRLVGGPEDDVLVGGAYDDVLLGRRGDDLLRGGAGSDKLGGGLDDDVLRGGRGDDRLIGGLGDDQLLGGKGDDRLIGGKGADRLVGGSDNDRLLGGKGDDRLIGGKGADRLVGGSDNDRLLGGKDDDRLVGGAGNDRLLGAKGDDELIGGSGNDRLVGGEGNDRLIGGAGDDRLIGGAGDDLFVFRAGHGENRILDFDPEHDRLAVRGLGPDEGLLTLDTGRDFLILGDDLSIRIVGGGEDGNNPVAWDDGGLLV